MVITRDSLKIEELTAGEINLIASLSKSLIRNLVLYSDLEGIKDYIRLEGYRDIPNDCMLKVLPYITSEESGIMFKSEVVNFSARFIMSGENRNYLTKVIRYVLNKTHTPTIYIDSNKALMEDDLEDYLNKSSK